MSWVTSIIIVLAIILFVMTWITEPIISWDYTKAYVTSGVKAFNWCKEQIGKFINKDNSNTEKRPG